MIKVVKLNSGYSVKIIKTIADSKGNAYEGYLIYRDKLVKDFKHDKLYITPDKLVITFLTKVLPAFIKKNKIGDLKHLQKKKDIHDFVKDYLLKNKITWGYTLDIIYILEEAGYKMPTISDRNFSIVRYKEYLEVVNKVSLMFVKRLNSFGFSADRVNSNTKHHPIKTKHDGCRNLIFTRYPWSNGYRANKTVKSLHGKMGKSFLRGKDIKTLSELHVDVAGSLKTLDDVMRKDAKKIECLLSEGFDLAFDNFDELVSGKQHDLIKVFQKLSPVNYGKYFD